MIIYSEQTGAFSKLLPESSGPVSIGLLKYHEDIHFPVVLYVQFGLSPRMVVDFWHIGQTIGGKLCLPVKGTTQSEKSWFKE